MLRELIYIETIRAKNKTEAWNLFFDTLNHNRNEEYIVQEAATSCHIYRIDYI